MTDLRRTGRIAPSAAGKTVGVEHDTTIETTFLRSIKMAAPSNSHNTGAWLTFTYVSFAISVGMMGVGVWALPADLWVKGYLTMAAVFMLGSTFTLAKTVRDEHEARRLANRLDDAKAERLLMEVGRAA